MDLHTIERRRWIRRMQSRRIPETLGGILAGLAFALLLNLF